MTLKKGKKLIGMLVMTIIVLIVLTACNGNDTATNGDDAVIDIFDESSMG